jgi:hypothetical protein
MRRSLQKMPLFWLQGSLISLRSLFIYPFLELFLLKNQTLKAKKEATTMATKKSTYIRILFGILIIAAWLLGSATQAGAQTYTVKCREAGYIPKLQVTEVGDVAGHIMGVVDGAGVLSCDDGNVATTSWKDSFDYIKGGGKAHGYESLTYEDGSTQWMKYQCTTTPSLDGKTSRWEGPFEFIKGTGRFEGIHGGWILHR